MVFEPNLWILLPERRKGNLLAIVLLIGLLVSSVLISPPGGQAVVDENLDDTHVTTWLSKEHARRLMRYHGTNGLKITADSVFIKRDGRWIRVYRATDPMRETARTATSPLSSASAEAKRRS